MKFRLPRCLIFESSREQLSKYFYTMRYMLVEKKYIYFNRGIHEYLTYAALYG